MFIRCFVKKYSKTFYSCLIYNQPILSDLEIHICVKIISCLTELHASMASDKSDESEVENQVNEDEVDLGFPCTDLILVVEGRKIHVNKTVLSEHSPVFNTMFNSEFKESTAEEIVLGDKKAGDVVEFLKCFYPNMEHPITGKKI